MNNNILELNNISKTFYTNKKEIEAIRDISFSIKDNEIISVVGPSGSGKSTLLNIIGNLTDKNGGTIEYPKGNIRIGYMFQTDALFGWLNILDNCLLGLKISNNITKDSKEYVISLLNKYGLGEFIYSYPSNLSGGMRQRVL